MSTLHIANDGQLITETNYWQSEYARDGILYVSVNAAAVRLLLPHRNTLAGELLEAARSASELILTRGLYRGQDAYELLYEDGTDEPFSLHIGIAGQADRAIPSSESGVSVQHTIWTRGFRDTPNMAHSMPGKIRTASQLPYLKVWGK